MVIMDRWIVVDAMGVIFTACDDVKELLIPYIKSLGIDIDDEVIHKLYIEASLGKITAQSFWDSLGIGKGYPKVQTEYLSRLVLDGDFIDVANMLKKKYRLALLSNDVGEWSAYLRKRHGLDKLFDEIIISGDVCVRKPSDEIYEILLNRTGAKPETCVFIDDKAENLAAAAAHGIKIIGFTRNPHEKTGFQCSAVTSHKETPALLGSLFARS